MDSIPRWTRNSSCRTSETSRFEQRENIWYSWNVWKRSIYFVHKVTPKHYKSIFKPSLSFRRNADGVQVTATEDSLSKSTFDPNKPIKVVTHGFRSGGETETCQSIKDAFLEKYDANVFIVDWGDIAGDPYWNAARYPQHVGNYTADFLTFLVTSGADAKKMHIVGHSLGAHLSGFTGKGMISRGNQVARVTGIKRIRAFN